MKVRFVKRHVIAGQTREDDFVYEVGQIVDFKTWVEETYARKYVDLGDAVEIDERAERKAAADAKTKADAATAAQIKADAEAAFEAVREIRQHRPYVTPAGEKLDRLCAEAIADYSGRVGQGESSMRGMQRLSNLTTSLTKAIDERADAVADRIQKAHDRGVQAISRFESYAADVEKNADEIEAALGQISNSAPLEESSNSAGSAPAAPKPGDA